MSNPYDDLFEEKTPKQEPPKREELGKELPKVPDLPEHFEVGKEPLDKILELMDQFTGKAEAFSKLLSNELNL